MARNWILIALGVVGLFPASELALQIVNMLVVSLLPPEPLPKLDFRDGIPPENATLIVVPMMLSSLHDVRADLERLEVRYLANRDANLFYSLFADFTDAPEAVTPRDAGLLNAVRDGIVVLNTRYPGRRRAFSSFSPSARMVGERAGAGSAANASAASWKS